MTVRELITKLEALDAPDLPVILDGCDCEDSCGAVEIKHVDKHWLNKQPVPAYYDPADDYVLLLREDHV